ncbi:MAG: hypothetical protein DME75_00935 [Verrucomicrobia bacterium]|nr:MAG: hypothetical protein DME75_00935 [Verrucomicrobiota bacterium]
MGAAPDTGAYKSTPCQHCNFLYLSRLMPKPIARSKTRKSVAKRFKITARGKRYLGKAARVDRTDVARVKANLPFG